MENFELCMNPPVEPKMTDEYGLKPLGTRILLSGGKGIKKLYTSIASYTGDASINQNIFGTKKDAADDCLRAFERAVAEGEKNDDLETWEWNEDCNCGRIDWTDGNQSFFEVNEANFFPSKLCSEFLTAEFDEQRLKDNTKES